MFRRQALSSGGGFRKDGKNSKRLQTTYLYSEKSESGGKNKKKNILKIEPQQNFLFFGQFLDNITKCSKKSKQNDLFIAQSRQRQIVKMYKNIAPNQQRDCVSVLGWFHILYRLLGKVGSHLKALAVVDPKFVGLY